MDIIINQQKIQKALHGVERLVSKNNSLPILNTILLKTDNGSLRLSATNLEMGINYWVGAKINKTGEIAVPVKVFSDFISNIQDEKILFSVNKNIITINSDNYKTQILGIGTSDFPLIPRLKGDLKFKIDSSKLRNGLLSVIDSVSLSETRLEISGVFVSVNENKIEFAATDSFRLAEKTIELNEGINKNFILPRNTAVELIKLTENLNEDIVISISDNQIFAVSNDFEFVSRLIDGHYPDYKKVIPEKYISAVKINKNVLEKNIRIASIFSSSISDIKLKAEKNNLQIVAQNNDKGDIVTNTACVVKNLPFEISVNYRYLLDGLKVFPSDDIVIQFTGEGSPLLLKSEEIKNQVYVIMPLRK